MISCLARRAALGLLASGLLAPAALAERADRDKPTLIEGDRCETDDLKQTSVCSGNVLLIRGTLRITGERMDVRQDPEGYRNAVINAAAGALATFRQRRDGARPGIEEYVEGMAERIEYDERTETVRFITRAQWKRLENGAPRDELAGSQIVYDSRTRTATADGKTNTPDGRVRIILAPTTDSQPAAPALPLAPAKRAPESRK